LTSALVQELEELFLLSKEPHPLGMSVPVTIAALKKRAWPGIEGGALSTG